MSKILPTFPKKDNLSKNTESIEHLNISKGYKYSKTCSKVLNLTCIGISCFGTSCFGSFGTSRFGISVEFTDHLS